MVLLLFMLSCRSVMCIAVSVYIYCNNGLKKYKKERERDPMFGVISYGNEAQHKYSGTRNFTQGSNRLPTSCWAMHIFHQFSPLPPSFLFYVFLSIRTFSLYSSVPLKKKQHKVRCCVGYLILLPFSYSPLYAFYCIHF